MTLTVNLILLMLMTLSALWSVMRGSLLRAVIALAVTSILLTILMFRFNSPLAAVFELSICTGLITVVFVSTISLTKPMTHKETLEYTKSRVKRFWYLPIVLVIVGIALAFIPTADSLPFVESAKETEVRNVLWKTRQLDLLGQILILLAGVFGIVVLFKDKLKGKNEI